MPRLEQEHGAQVYNFSSEKSLSKLSVLRICNQLLRRLSRASSSELCGRILMFLTRLLPLLDRSGLNVQGQFNTSHSTPVEDVPEACHQLLPIRPAMHCTMPVTCCLSPDPTLADHVDGRFQPTRPLL